MEIEIVTPIPMTRLEMEERDRKRQEAHKTVLIDFSEEKIEKALFLDIDGVIQPFTKHRFKYARDEEHMKQLYKELEEKFGADYREFHWADVTATVYDWDKDAVAEIKRILDVTGAKIVVSSDWRDWGMTDCLPFLFRIHDLQKYLYGYTPLFLSGVSKLPEYKNLKHYRSIEILEYLRVHPHIKKWVAIDDKDMSCDIPQNFVKTYPKVTALEADRCIEILGKIKGGQS